MPCTETPTIRRVPRPEATARAWSVEISCVRMPDAGAGRHSGKRAAIVTCTRRACRALAHPLRDLLGEPFGAPARGADDGIADHVADDLLEARRVRGRPRGSGSTTQSMRAGNGCAERSSTPRRTIVSTPVSPTRDGDEDGTPPGGPPSPRA